MGPGVVAHGLSGPEAREFFLTEGQCFVIVARDQFRGGPAFAHIQSVADRWAEEEREELDADEDGDDAPPIAMVH